LRLQSSTIRQQHYTSRSSITTVAAAVAQQRAALPVLLSPYCWLLLLPLQCCWCWCYVAAATLLQLLSSAGESAAVKGW
jgi:hypothetical protein